MKVIKILHVEDVPEDYEQIDRILKKSGLVYESKCVSTKAGFVNALSEFKPDIILCDHSLPAFSSVEAAKLLREKDLKIPLILVTGTLSEVFLSDVLKSGIDDYVLKDRPLRLPSAIKSALEKNELEQKKDEYFNTILQQEKRFRALIENLSEAIVLVDRSGKIVYHSPSASRLTGFGNAEVEHMNVFSFFHPEDFDRAITSFRKCAVTPRCTIEDSFRIRNKDGNYFWVEGSITNLLDESSIQGYIVNYRDVTERMRGQQQLAESEAHLRTIFDNTETSYVFVSKDFKVLSFNQPAIEMYRIIGTGILRRGANLLELLPEDRRTEVNMMLGKVLNGERFSYEMAYDDKGLPRWFNISLLPIVNGKNKDVFGIIVSAKDITSRKLIELEREKMTTDLIVHVKNLEQFAYIVSHNLRSPVANIIGLAAMLQEMPSMSNTDRKKCLQGLSVSAEKLDEIIKDLNYILQVRHNVNEKRELVKVSSILKDIIKNFQNIIASENITIDFDFSRGDELLSVRTYLYSILFNLVSNGIKYRHRHRACIIHIKGRIIKNNFELYYEDNGLGIDLGVHSDKIFGLYKRFHNHTEGKGIGLYMVKTQVEMLGGTITVSSKHNEGIKFRILLPIQD